MKKLIILLISIHLIIAGVPFKISKELASAYVRKMDEFFDEEYFNKDEAN